VNEERALQRAWLLNAGVTASAFDSCVVLVGSGDRLQTLELMVRMGGASDVHTVTDARFIARRFLALHPDLVLIDLDTSPVEGCDVLAALRRVLADEEFLPVLVIAGDRSIRASQRVVGAAVDLITKPYDQAELVGRVSMRWLYRTLKHHNIDRRADSNVGT